MKIIPAIDLLDGQAVRLEKGDYSKKTVYSDNPVELTLEFKTAGFNHIHVVDLNGAKSGKFENIGIIKTIIDKHKISVQTGGGVRSRADFEQLIRAGIAGVICSSFAVKKPDEWLQCIHVYPGQAILGLDLKNGKMAYGGWLETSDKPLSHFLGPMIEAGLQTVLSTDISRDGMLTGPNFDMYRNLQNEFPELNWIASGGVSSIEDLKKLKEENVYGVVVGKAYYEGKITLDMMAASSDD